MFRRLYFFLTQVAYSFPVQLLLNNIRRNHVLLICWMVLFAMITGSFGKYLGIPYLFLDPEYLNQVNFTSFFILGLALAGFIMAFHITCYITDGYRFSFIGTLPRPFTKFYLNNSIIPLLFVATYVYEIIRFQINNEYSSTSALAWNLGGLTVGLVCMTVAFFLYFRFTNKDIVRYMVCRIDEKIKQNVKVTRASAMKKLNTARKKQIQVDYYLDDNLRMRRVEKSYFYDKSTILQVFDQNHFNLVVIELLIFVLLMVLGLFKDYPAFQLPAAASFIIFMTVFVMLAGAFSYWFGDWSATAALVVFLVINHLVGENYFSKPYQAFGLRYHGSPAAYSVSALRAMNDSTHIATDRAATLDMLTRWRQKFPPHEKPRMVFVCVSGGGKRAALWALTALQTADSLSGGDLYQHSILITGASGGLIGASYFRELKLREQQGEHTDPHDAIHRKLISSDNLNPLIFSLLANDLFVGFTKFQYAGDEYYRDRGYTFEEQLNQITERMLDKPLSAYDSVERSGTTPMVILTPTIINDGRKLYIASRPVSFMNEDAIVGSYTQAKFGGVDFQTLLREQGAPRLRFLSALRMSATFPYITPNTTLPTDPPIQIMDAGISDNFGLSDAVRFLYSFREWIADNTSGVVLLSIRDSPKLGTIAPKVKQTLVDDLTQPISSVYNNFENFQDINSDMAISYARTWFRGDIQRIDLEYQVESYVPILQQMDSIRHNNPRASLSWRLTTREKESVVSAINTVTNQQQINKLKSLLTPVATVPH